AQLEHCTSRPFGGMTLTSTSYSALQFGQINRILAPLVGTCRRNHASYLATRQAHSKPAAHGVPIATRSKRR
ncbi:MAG: hypothetical protein ACI90Y_001066, partial [Polaromonas sp.]